MLLNWPSSSKGCGALLAFGFASLLGGCGEAEGYRLGGSLESGGDVKRPDAAAKLRVGSCRSGADLEMVDDMEDKNQAILQTAGRAGSWFAFNDQTGTQTPQAQSSLFPMEGANPPRAGSQFAVRTYGSGFTGWGAGVGFEFATTLAYDARSYAGIAFWARVEPGSSSNLRFNVTDRNTSQYGGVCDLDCQPDVGPIRTNEPTDGKCEPSSGPCYDDFGADLAAKITGEWQLFTFPWDKLLAKDWSRKRLPGISKDAIYGLRFQANGPPVGGSAVEFDVWIDDVSFLCH